MAQANLRCVGRGVSLSLTSQAEPVLTNVLTRCLGVRPWQPHKARAVRAWPAPGIKDPSVLSPSLPSSSVSRGQDSPALSVLPAAQLMMDTFL